MYSFFILRQFDVNVHVTASISSRIFANQVLVDTKKVQWECFKSTAKQNVIIFIPHRIQYMQYI